MNQKLNVMLGPMLLAVLLGITTGAGYFALLPSPQALRVIRGDGIDGPFGMVWVPGGEFLMGNDNPQAAANERPAHRVYLGGFWMDEQDVSNRQFQRFVEETGYLTTAESGVQRNDGTHSAFGKPIFTQRSQAGGGMVYMGSDQDISIDDELSGWRFIPGAHWRCPQGPGSNIIGKEAHPVVQVSYEDAQAYAHWAGKNLPTEAQWEFAFRGGLESTPARILNAVHSTGKIIAPGADLPGAFAALRSKYERTSSSTGPLGHLPANDYGLYDMAKRIWRWTADWYRADAFRIQAQYRQLPVDPLGPADSFDPDDRNAPAKAPKRVTRGGSLWCSDTYCIGHRASMRRGMDPMRAMSHLGFRTVMTPEQWKFAQSQARHMASR